MINYNYNIDNMDSLDFTDFRSITLDERQMCDLELLLNGAFSPLTGFLGEADYHSVLDNLRLSSGEVWPIPIVLKVPIDVALDLINTSAPAVTLRNEQFLPIAVLHISDIYRPNIENECLKVFGCIDENHEYMKLMLDNPDVYYIGGRVEKIQEIPHFDFQDIRLTPAQTKQLFKDLGWNTILAFQTRNPMHRSHIELTKYALRKINQSNEGNQGNQCVPKLLIHPVVGPTQDCDIPYPVRVRCYKKLLSHYPANTATLSLLPLSMRMAGPREALWHALIRQNYGCTHFAVGRDHAGPSHSKKNGEKFFDPYGAHDLLAKYQDELTIKIIPSKFIVYVKDVQEYHPIDEVKSTWSVEHISGTELRKCLSDGGNIPEWFSYPDVVDELRCAYPNKYSRGFCVYFVGLSGSGKTTVALALQAKLEELIRYKKVTVLDGDVVRHHLSSELGFSKDHRSLNVRRIGYVASEIVKHGGICLCANIAPYASDRDANRQLITSTGGGYIEIYVDTPLQVCESRDVKGLYKLARCGKIKEFTGVSDPFEKPETAEITVTCASYHELSRNIDRIIDKLRELDYLI